jgi:hypothetical protein
MRAMTTLAVAASLALATGVFTGQAQANANDAIIAGAIVSLGVV